MASFKPFRFLSDARSAMAVRAARWARARQGDDALPLTLLPRRVYILPTRGGLAAAAFLFVMLLAGLNYANSLALLLCFMLTGLALVSMHECHRTLAGVQITQAHGESTFAARQGQLILSFMNADTRVRGALQICHPGCDGALFQLEPGGSATARMRFQANRRGRQRIERLKIWTDAPLGLFRAWSWLHLPLDVLVYPAPAGVTTLPGRRGQPRGRPQRAAGGGDDEWAWLRPYQESDSPRGVAWKAYARGAPLMVAQYQAAAGADRVLDFQSLSQLDVEQRLSQLTLWILECERRHEAYALRLPSREIEPGLGGTHQRICLEALALCPP
jgi:uncharacterized protein (DUF58 family)